MFLATWVATLAVIEIKPIKPEPPVGEHEAFWRDLLKLIAFRNIGYEAAFMLVSGEPIDRMIDCGAELRKAESPIDHIELWHHGAPGEPARPLAWR